jgi:hypothetical protein
VAPDGHPTENSPVTSPRTLGLALAACLTFPAPGRAQQTAADAAAAPALAARPSATARRVARPPVIDGRLDDATWQESATASGFVQREPVAGQPASEPTVVRIAYDDRALYFGVELRDSAPDQVVASELRRDNTLEGDDTFTVLLDTYRDRRNAFLFRVNPRGTRYDGQIRNESRFIYSDWDEQWTAAATPTDTGWTAEIAIPFKILRFSSDAEQVWGLNFERVIKRKNEFAYWSGWDRNVGFHNVSEAGELQGLRELKLAERVRLRPYIVAGVERLDAVAAPRGREASVQVGIDDLKWTVTPNLTADLAVNPDFAQTEVDAQRVNLTRFSLFFPEKRQFFIEGADSLRMGVGLLHFGPPPLELFYSRAIGLSADGREIPVVGGGKLTGKAAGFDVGVLGAGTDRQSGVPGEGFFVGRVRKEVLGRSYVGAIVTDRETGGRFNRVVAADGRFVFKRYLNVGAILARQFDSTQIEGQWARQLGAEWRDDFLELGMNYISIDRAFRPGIGFVQRNDRLLGYRLSLKPRPAGRLVRQFEITPSLVVNHDDTGTLRSRNAQMQVSTNFESGDRLIVGGGNLVEHPGRAFRIAAGATIPSDRFEWNEGVVSFRSYNGRKATVNATVSGGGFYSGTRRGYELSSDLRPSKNLSLSPSYAFNDIQLATGDFDTHLFGLRANVNLSTNLLTSTYLQYNSTGDLAALQVRVNYIFRTIDNFYIVYNDTRFTAGPFDGRANRSLVVKTTYSVHR